MKENALANVQRLVRQCGQDVIFIDAQSSDVESNEWDDAVSNSTAPQRTVKGFPITESPTPKEMEEAGFQTQVDLIIYTSTLDWRKLHTLEFEDIKKKHMEIIYKDGTYKTETIIRFSQFSTEFLYILFGAVRK